MVLVYSFIGGFIAAAIADLGFGIKGDTPLRRAFCILGGMIGGAVYLMNGGTM